jgi:hypothetical protein
MWQVRIKRVPFLFLFSKNRNLAIKYSKKITMALNFTQKNLGIL